MSSTINTSTPVSATSTAGAALPPHGSTSTASPQPLDPQSRAIEGFRRGTESERGDGSLQSQALTDAAGNARAALERTDLPADKSAAMKVAVQTLGNAVLDGRAQLPSDMRQSLYDLATQPSGHPAFERALGHVEMAADLLNESAQAGGTAEVAAEAPAEPETPVKSFFAGDTPMFDPGAPARDPGRTLHRTKDGGVDIRESDGRVIHAAPRPTGKNDAFRVAEHLNAQRTPEQKANSLVNFAESVGGRTAANATENALWMFKHLGGDADAKVKATLFNKVELECSAVEGRCAASFQYAGEGVVRSATATPTQGGVNIEVNGQKEFVPVSGNGGKFLEKLQPLPKRETDARVEGFNTAIKDAVDGKLKGAPDFVKNKVVDAINSRLPNLVKTGEYGFKTTLIDNPALKLEVSGGGNALKAVEGTTRFAASAFVTMVINEFNIPKPNLSNVMKPMNDMPQLPAQR